MKPFIYNIEVAGMCNLRCPSCPVGNTKATDLQEPRPKGLMQPSLFYKILEKIQRDHPHSAETLVRLYSWGEPCCIRN
jgi:MoaA/NifB/PqqE/SkfB family radical SAM enzyme